MCFHLALVFLSYRQTLENHLFNLDRLEQLNFITTISTQAFSVVSLAALLYFVQSIAGDKIIKTGMWRHRN